MKKNYITLLIIAIVLTNPCMLKAQWTKIIYPFPSSYRIADIAVKDSAIIAVGYSLADFHGLLFKSFNYGTSWDTLPSISTAGYLFETITFKDNDTAIIGGMGSNTLWLRSTDAGHNWNYYLADTTTGVADMVFLDGQRGFSTGYNTSQFFSGNCYYTSDGGNSWQKQTTTAGTCLDTLGLDRVYFVDAQTGYGVSNFGLNKYLLKTTDTGKHWNIIYTQEGIGDVYFWNVMNGVMVAEGGQIFKTSDGGMHWTLKPSPATAPLFSVSFIDNNVGYAVGAFGVIVKTVNGGENWTHETSPTGNTLFRVRCVDGIGYATGDGGTVLRSVPKLGVSTLPLKYKLNIYPNPASSVVYISSTTGQNFKTINATLKDINGRTIRTGSTNQALMQMNIKDVPTGIYTVLINADGQQYSEKINIQH